MAPNMATNDTQGELHTASHPRRRALPDFHCPHSDLVEERCGEDCPMSCRTRIIYREYLALRAVVDAELAGTSAQAEASAHRSLGDALIHKDQAIAKRCYAQADAWDGLREAGLL